ncbi:MAG: S9 family peptidase, partial [Dokdonella sp.]
MRRIAEVMLAVWILIVATPVGAISLEMAMDNPDWIGPPVENPYWSVDGRTIYYSLKRDGSSVRDLHRIDPATRTDTIIDPAAMAQADGRDSVFDRSRQRAAFVRNGDVFIRDLTRSRLVQVTRTSQEEADPRFSADGRALHFRSDNDWFVYDTASGVTAAAFALRAEKDPDEKKPDELAELQLRLFSTLRTIKADREAGKENTEAFQKGDPTRAPLPFFLGDEIKIEGASLSPDGQHVLVTTSPKGFDAGKVAKLQRYVTESGYEEQEDERVRV